MATEQTAIKLIDRLIQIDDELIRGEQPGLYDHLERVFQCDVNTSGAKADAWTYQRTGAEWYDKRIHPMQISRLMHHVLTSESVDETVERLERFVCAHMNGGVMSRRMDERTLQAKRIWTAGWGMQFDAADFGDYLASIPPVPDVSPDFAKRFPNLMLVDARTSPSEACWMADVLPDDEDGEWIFHGLWTLAGAGAYWLRYRSEVLYQRSPTPKAYVASFKEPERRFTLLEGLFMCVHDFKRRRTLPMAFSGTMIGRDRSTDPDRWPLIRDGRIECILSAEHQELQVPSCLSPEG